MLFILTGCGRVVFRNLEDEMSEDVFCSFTRVNCDRDDGDCDRCPHAPGSIWRCFHDAHFDSLWASGGGPCPNTWHAGVWTGPDRDLICVMRCSSRELADEALSPACETPEKAVAAALEIRRRLLEKRGQCPGEFSGRVKDRHSDRLLRERYRCQLPSGHDPNCSPICAPDSPWRKK